MSNTNGLDITALARLNPISNLLEDQIVELASQTQEQPLLAGKTLFKKGDTGSELIYLIEGEIEIHRENGEPTVIKSGSPESRHPIDNHSPHHVTAVALSPSLFIRIDSDLVDTMLTWAEGATSDAEEVIMSGSDIIHIDASGLKNKMQRSPNFRKLPAANIDLLLEKMEPIRMNAGEVIIRQGDEGDYFYVIEEGEALVTRMVDDDEDTEDAVEMAHLGEGSCFGEAALISDSPRNATVSMQTDGVLLRLNKENFLKLMQDPIQNWVDVNAAKQLVDAGATWVDVRSPTDFAEGHLPGAINIPMNEAHRRSQALDKSKPYVCYCQTGRRSSAAAFILSQYGFEVNVLKGGLPTIDGDVELVSESKAS